MLPFVVNKDSLNLSLTSLLLLFLYPAPSEGSIPMNSGEEFFVIETDQGDGWTRVRRRANSEEGFVPTTYIRSSAYSAV